MPLTPQDIVRKEFREALRGYNQSDVDLFLDEVVEEFARVTEENQKMKVKIAALQQEVSRYRANRGAMDRGGATSSGAAEAERLEVDVRARIRRLLEEQLRVLDSADARPPSPASSSGAPGARDTGPIGSTAARGPAPEPPRPEPRAVAEEPSEPFWANE